ncbi:branched-chain amino acid ABC transporter permease [Bradyrhizobium sp.]|uniref:branched-chain amino acid ABC transporter permease n=1 Tax=Bradyrhizobium sp. TaxID=376 RepID=UPI0039E50B02
MAIVRSMQNHLPAIVCLYLAILPAVLPSYFIATEVVILAIATLASVFLLGRLGHLSFGQAAFFGLGSYVSGYAAKFWGLGIVPSLALSAVLGTAVAAAIGWLALRRHGLYFIMLTLAFGQLCYHLAFALEPLTGGERGLLDIPRGSVGWSPMAASMEAPLPFYCMCAIVLSLLFYMLRRIELSPFGFALASIRVNESRASAVGYDTHMLKTLAFAISGGVTAIAGGLNAFFLNSSPLSSIDFTLSLQIAVTSIIGGWTSLFGAILGATFYVVLSGVLAEHLSRWMLIYGVLLIVIVLFMRGGLWGGITSLASLLRSTKGGQSDTSELRIS